MPKFVFSSDDLPRHLPNAARVSTWRDHFFEMFGPAADPVPKSDVLFRSSIEAVLLNDMTLGVFQGTFSKVHRTKSGVAAEGSDRLTFLINTAPEPYHMVQNGREVVVGAGGAAFFSEGMVGTTSYRSQGAADSFMLRVPRQALAGALRTPEDYVMKPADPGSEALRMLTSYTRTLIATGGLGDPATAQSVGSHFVDLIALSLGNADREAAERGLRAGRLNAVLAEISGGFADPAFSAQVVAKKLRISVRYLHDLLHETGRGFGARVLEHRLQNAWRLLSLAQYSHRKVTDIAFVSGFSDISYFNRAFRARFGMTPSDARAVAALASRQGEAPVVRASDAA